MPSALGQLKMIQVAKADTRELIDEAPVRFMVVEKTKNYTTRLLVQFMMRHYRFES